MTSRLWLAGIALLLVLPGAYAQTVLASSKPPVRAGSALPPPGINDPGVKVQSVPLPNTGIPQSVAPAARQHDGKGQPPPNVSVTTNDKGDTVEVFKRSGHVFMVRVVPKHGVAQTYYYDNPGGALTRDPRLGAVAPVYYTIYRWGGKAKPTAASSSGR